MSTPQYSFEKTWVMSRSYAANATKEYILSNPNGTLAGLLEHFEEARREAEESFGLTVVNGVVVPAAPKGPCGVDGHDWDTDPEDITLHACTRPGCGAHYRG